MAVEDHETTATPSSDKSSPILKDKSSVLEIGAN